AVVDEAVPGLARDPGKVQHELGALRSRRVDRVERGERQRDDGCDVDGSIRLAPREDEAVLRGDLEELSAGGEDLAGLVVRHRVPVAAADLHVERHGVRADAERTEPLCELGLDGPGPPHEVAWRMEGASDR